MARPPICTSECKRQRKKFQSYQGMTFQMTAGIMTYACVILTRVCVYIPEPAPKQQRRGKGARDSHLISGIDLKEWALFCCRWHHLAIVTENFPVVFSTISHPELPVNTPTSWTESGSLPSAKRQHSSLKPCTSAQCMPHPCIFPWHLPTPDSLTQLSLWAKHILSLASIWPWDVFPHISRGLGALCGHWIPSYYLLWRHAGSY